MAGRLNEIEASMDAVVDDLLTVDTVLLFEVSVITRLDVLNDWFPARGSRGKWEEP